MRASANVLGGGWLVRLVKTCPLHQTDSSSQVVPTYGLARWLARSLDCLLAKNADGNAREKLVTGPAGLRASAVAAEFEFVPL